MRAFAIRLTAVTLIVLGPLRGESRAQRGGAAVGGHGAAGAVGTGGITPNGYGGVNRPAYGVVGGGVASPGWVGGYGYPYGPGYGADSFNGIGMSPMDQEMVKQLRMINLQAQAHLAASLAQESQARTIIAQQKASERARADRDTPGRTRPSPARKPARASGSGRSPRPGLESLVGPHAVRWPVHGFPDATLAIRSEADVAVLAVRAEVAARGGARPDSVSLARSKLARFRASARSHLPVNSKTLTRLDVFLLALDEALVASAAGPADGRQIVGR